MAHIARTFGSFLQKSTNVLCNNFLMTSNSIAMQPQPVSWALMFVRTNIRNNFPRARETKRILVHGWNTRMKTLSGRKILMRRILKGRHVLSH